MFAALLTVEWLISYKFGVLYPNHFTLRETQFIQENEFGSRKLRTYISCKSSERIVFDSLHFKKRVIAWTWRFGLPRNEEVWYSLLLCWPIYARIVSGDNGKVMKWVFFILPWKYTLTIGLASSLYLPRDSNLEMA